MIKPNSKVMVTGATGFLGTRLVHKLIGQGFTVSAFARTISNIEKLKALDIDIFFGDVGDEKSLTEALEWADIVVHAAADTSGNHQNSLRSTIAGTQNVINEAQAQGVMQLIYISSCSVYGVADCKSGDSIDESGPLERQPEIRGSYTHAKCEAEQFVRHALKRSPVNITCLRPGTIWGPGGAIYTPMMGFNVGQKVFGVIGDGEFVLPLIYIDNLVDVIIKCIDNERAFNQTYNVVDAQQVTKKLYVDKLLKPLYENALIFNIPYWLLYSAVCCQEFLFKLLMRPALLSRYRLTSSQRHIVYDAAKIKQELDWDAPVNFEEAVGEVISYEQSR